MKEKWLIGSIIEKKVWADRLISLIIHTPDFPLFKPGQFIKIKTVDLDAVKVVSRCYSIVSHPFDKHIEIYFDVVEQGSLTPILEKLSVGDQLLVSDNPGGNLTIDNVRDNHTLWMIATGTGIGPFVSMIRDRSVFLKFHHIFVVHGVKNVEHLAYRSVFIQHPEDITYIPCVTQEQQNRYFNQRVTDLISLPKYDKILTKEQSSVIVCGNKQMINDVNQILRAKGYPPNSNYILHEKYW